MDQPSKFEEQIQQRIDDLNTRLYTLREFNDVIRGLLDEAESPLSAVLYEGKCSEHFEHFKAGCLAQQNVTCFNTNDLHDNRGTSLTTKIWYKPSALHSPQIETLLGELFKAFWKPAFRTPTAGVLDYKRDSKIYSLAQHTIEMAIGGNCALLFCDLDHFKQVNDTISYDKGDIVLKIFGSILERASGDKAIVLQKGGDEFLVLAPACTTEDALDMAREISHIAKNTIWNVGDIAITVSIGIAIASKQNKKNFNELCSEAEKALKSQVKEVFRGRTRFIPLNTVTATPYSNSDLALNYAEVITRSLATSNQPFANCWLNVLSNVIYHTATQSFEFASIKKTIDDYLKWTGLDTSYTTLKSALSQDFGIDTTPTVCLVDYAFAVTHGLYRYMMSGNAPADLEFALSMKYSADFASMGINIIEKNNTHNWSFGTTAHEKELNLGICKSQPNASVVPGFKSGAVLICIGHEKTHLPLSIFEDIITIDDRPVRGGGLPDFWEATIAKLINKVLKNPNIQVVYVYGNPDHAPLTTHKLTDISNWENAAEDLAYKTALPETKIKEAASRLKDKIKFVKTHEELIHDLAQRLYQLPELKPLDKSHIEQAHRFLQRELKTDDMALRIEDGIRVHSASEAFPLVLEILRKSENVATIKDQAGYEMRELVDFKVHLADPYRDDIPTYCSKDNDLLLKYYQNQFENNEGLFGKIFNESGQLEAVIKHVAQVINQREKQFATRRAILVIPHITSNITDIAPLGLVSIRIVPRYSDSRIFLNYSFTWRSVEALVGFPYSLYGSIQYSKLLKDKICALSSELKEHIHNGFLSYIAHSLHMSVDDSVQNIARKIIDDASL
jgi:diguanylate cyclase (GGDEF)-like protein